MSMILTEQIIPNLTLFSFENHLLGLDRNTSSVFEILEDKECIELTDRIRSKGIEEL